MARTHHPLSGRDWLGVVVVAALATVVGLMVAVCLMWFGAVAGLDAS
jgi:hypothetical protein